MNKIENSGNAKTFFSSFQFGGRITDDLIKPGLRLTVIRFRDSKNLRIRLRVVAYRNRAARFGYHLPALRRGPLFQIHVDTRDAASPFVRLREQHAVDVDGGNLAMRVTHEDDIDPRNLIGNRERGV